MPYFVVQNDITKMHVDAIVNAANSSLLGGGGVDGAIHRAAGPMLLEECRTLNGCKTGEAKLTNGYKLPAKYVIHTVGPIYHDGLNNEEQLLRNCYVNSLNIAANLDIESIAFPLISSGVYGYPKDKAREVAESVIREFLQKYDMTVYLVLYDKSFFVYDNPIDRREIIEERRNHYSERSCSCSMMRFIPPRELCENDDVRYSLNTTPKIEISQDYISFSEMLLDLIDQRNISDADFYKKANISRKVFSKARQNDYRPSKETAIAFGLALELDKDSFDDFLNKAGFALSDYIVFDKIIAKCIEKHIYDVFEVNNILYDYDQKTLGQ